MLVFMLGITLSEHTQTWELHYMGFTAATMAFDIIIIIITIYMAQ